MNNSIESPFLYRFRNFCKLLPVPQPSHVSFRPSSALTRRPDRSVLISPQDEEIDALKQKHARLSMDFAEMASDYEGLKNHTRLQRRSMPS